MQFLVYQLLILCKINIALWNLGKVTIEKIRERTHSPDGKIFLYVTTSVMLLGLDLKDVPIVILFSPFHTLNSFIQAGGRAGRRSGDGERTRSVLYALWNNSDIRPNLPNLDNSVRDFFKTSMCLKEYVNKYFSNNPFLKQNNNWCCSNCSFFQ